MKWSNKEKLRKLYGPFRRLAVSALARIIFKEDVKWVVNDIAELGVKIGPRQFYMYKGRSLEYDGLHDNSVDPMLFRSIEVREFGEVCHPPGYRIPDGLREAIELTRQTWTRDNYPVEYPNQGYYTYGLGWRPMSKLRAILEILR